MKLDDMLSSTKKIYQNPYNKERHMQLYTQKTCQMFLYGQQKCYKGSRIVLTSGDIALSTA